MDVDEGLSLMHDDLRREAYRRREDVWIADLADEIPHHIGGSFFRNARHCTIVQNAEENVAAIAV